MCDIWYAYVVGKEAKIAVDEALAVEGNNLTMLVAASEIYDGLGDATKTIESLRKLAEVDRRRRQDYLERIARLQARKKNWADAIETAKEVVHTVPSKIEGYELLAQICFQAKSYTLGIETLRKALRIDPNSTRVAVALGTALAERKNYDEAIELVWQSFAKSNSLDDKLKLTTKLSNLVSTTTFGK